jgi:CubicO group peptidase (beta-lactamase class C family)
VNKRTRTKLPVILAVAAMSQGCLTDPDMKMPFVGFEPERVDDGWAVSTPEAEGLDAAGLERVFRDFFREDIHPTARGLLVVRRGKLVAEGYPRDPADRERLHNVQSATKSVTSLAAGIALDEGLLPSVDVPLYDLMPQHFDDDPRKRTLTLRDALSMRTGLAFDNDKDTGAFMHSDGSSLANVLHRPLIFDPGTDYWYTDGNAQLVSGAVHAAAGTSLETFAADRLFAPLGIRRWRWEHHADGVSFGANGLWLRPRDMARLGQLMLQGGVWQGRRLVSSAWLEESLRIQANGDYGLYWWVYHGGRIFAAKGAGGQQIVVVPELELVVVLTADPWAHSWEFSPGIGEVMDRVLAAAGWRVSADGTAGP